MKALDFSTAAENALAVAPQFPAAATAAAADEFPIYLLEVTWLQPMRLLVALLPLVLLFVRLSDYQQRRLRLEL